MTATKRSWISMTALVLITMAATFVVSEDAMAQKADSAKAASTKKVDKSSASKQGVAESLGNKEIDANKLPGKLEIGIAFGSVAGAIAAIKYL